MENNTNIRPITYAPTSIDGKVGMQRIAKIVGVSTVTAYRQYHAKKGPCYELAQKYGYESRKYESYQAKKAAEKEATWYYGGNFHTAEEERQRMTELRAQGYSNKQIAQKVGRVPITVRRAIGPQDPEMSKLNRQLGQKIRAQRNAARKQYVTNKPIREHNARVEAANKKKAELEKMQAELAAMQEVVKTEQPAIEQAAQVEIEFPMFDLRTIQPTALM